LTGAKVNCKTVTLTFTFTGVHVVKGIFRASAPVPCGGTRGSPLGGPPTVDPCGRTVMSCDCSGDVAECVRITELPKKKNANKFMRNVIDNKFS